LSIARHDSIAAMLASLLYMVLRRLLTVVAPKHRSDDAAQIEIFVLRHQLQVLRRQVKRPVYRHGDRALSLRQPDPSQRALGCGFSSPVGGPRYRRGFTDC
jgi:hypothetical protein